MQTQIQVLSEDEKAQVHERTLKVLSTVGLRCDTAEGRRILAAAGADVDEATRRVRFPAELVEKHPRLYACCVFAENAVKIPFFKCQDCGQCILSYTAFACCMKCPKQMPWWFSVVREEFWH